MTEVQQEVQQEVQDAQQEQVVITIQDLDAATKIVGAFIERGAVRAAEAEDVGKIWKKLAAFVQQAAASQEQEETQEVGE